MQRERAAVAVVAAALDTLVRKRRVCQTAAGSACGASWQSRRRNLLASLRISTPMVDVDALLAAPIATADATTTLKSVIAGKKTVLLFVRNFA